MKFVKDILKKNKAELIAKLSEKLLCNEVIEDYKIVTIKKHECPVIIFPV